MSSSRGQYNNFGGGSVTSFPSDDDGDNIDAEEDDIAVSASSNVLLVSQTQQQQQESPVRPLGAPSSQPAISSQAGDDEEEEDFEDAMEQHQQQAFDAAEGSGISGKGMWDAWTRSFDTPLLAFLDLLDNAVDASWSLLQSADGIEKPRIQIDVDDQIGSGGILMRNASKYIPPLSEVLQVYKSKKGSAKDSIGENGIGVKHACASLSDLSFVFAKRDMEYLSVGILMKDLQEDKAIILPSFEWHNSVNIPDELDKLCTVTHPDTWGKALEAYGDGDLDDGMNQCFRQMMAIQEGEWKDYPNVFTMVLNELKHEGLDSVSDAHVEDGGDAHQQHREKKTAEEKSLALMNELTKKMPYLYLHLNSFEVKIQKKVVKSTYWERRLVELTKFELEIPTEEHWSKMHRELYEKGRVTDIKDPKKSVRFFLGFNPFRSSDEGEEAASDDLEAETDLGLTGGRNVNSASLKVYLYSRQSGRLIKVEHDPRSKLGLGSGSTNFNQGLTVIIDDYNGTIPLNPTKQDTSYGHSSHGQIHSDNVNEWTAALTHFYWTYHFEMIANESKKALSEAVSTRMEDIRALMAKPDVAPFSYGNFIEYENLIFRLQPRKNGASLRTTKHVRKQCYATFAGSDDLFSCPLIRLDEDAAGIKLQEEAKKKAQKDAHKRRRESVEDDETEVMMNQRAQSRAIANSAGRNRRNNGVNEGVAFQQVAVQQNYIVNLQQEIAQLKRTLEDQTNQNAIVIRQRNNEKFRADKLDQDLAELRKQIARPSHAGSGGFDDAATQALLSQLEEANRKNKELHDEIETLKANAGAYGGGVVGNGGDVAKLNKKIASLLQQLKFYQSEKESAKQQIHLLMEEKARMESRVAQLEASQFDFM